MRIFGSLTFRLAMIYVALFIVSVAFLAGVQYWVGVHIPLEAAKDQIRAEAREFGDIYILDGRDELAKRLDMREGQPGEREAFHAFIDDKGQVVTTNLPSWPKSVSDDWLMIEADRVIEGVENESDVLLLDRRFEDGARLLIGRDIEEIDDRREVLSAAAAWIIGVSLLLGLSGGVLMSLVVGRRIDVVTRAARRVIDGDLSGRVPVRGTGDDFDRLGETLNLMLARIDELVASIRRVSDSVAHELRTPLARLRANLDDLAAEGDGEHAETIDRCIEEARRLEAVFDAVLRIARIESGRHERALRPVPLATLLDDAVELYQPLAEQREVGIERAAAGADEGVEIAGDADLLFQAFCNLIDNAIKYAPSGGQVGVSFRRTPGAVVVAVTDDGPGIPAEHRDKVTQRFYRVDDTAAAPGIGLGLSFVEAVAKRHGAWLMFGDAGPGLKVELGFPVRRVPAPAG